MGMDEWYTVSPGTGMAYSQRSAVGCARGLEAHTHTQSCCCRRCLCDVKSARHCVRIEHCFSDISCMFHLIVRGRHRIKTMGFRSLLNPFSQLFQRQLSPNASWEMFFWEILRLHCDHTDCSYRSTKLCYVCFVSNHMSYVCQ